MKKIKGFTLAEVLVTVGIIGIVAAITLPLINRFSPDATKVQYLKTYDMLVKTMNKIANNKIYYPETVSDGYNYSYIEYPLVNTSKITINKKEITAGTNKIARVFSDYTGLACTGCENNNYSSSYPGTPMFTTKDNVGLYITTYKEQKTKEIENTLFTPQSTQSTIDTTLEIGSTVPSLSSGISISNGLSFDSSGIGSNNIFILTNNFVYKTDIYADIDGTVFKFILTADGKVQPADDIGKKYLETRNTWKNLNYSNVDIKNKNNYTPTTEFKLTKFFATEIKIPDLNNETTTDSDPTVDGGPAGYDPCSECRFPPNSDIYICYMNNTCILKEDYERNKTKIDAMWEYQQQNNNTVNFKTSIGY